MTSLSLDVVIRGAGSIRSPSEHVAAVETDASRILITTADSPEPETLVHELDANPEEPLLVYGDEALLSLLGERPVHTVWLVVGPGLNPMRNVWRLRGAHPWLAKVNLALLLEEQAAAEAIAASQLLKTGRIAMVATLPPVAAPAEILAEVAATQMEDAIPVMPTGDEPGPELSQPEPAAETPTAETPTAETLTAGDEPVAEVPLTPADPLVSTEAHEPVAETPLAEEGVSEEMSVYPYVPAAAALMETEQNTEQALIKRYGLVKERRTLLPKMAQTEEVLTNLLKEIFVTRYTTGPDAAGVFVDLTAKLAQTAVEYKEMSETLTKVEQQLEALAWLKNELDM